MQISRKTSQRGVSVLKDGRNEEEHFRLRHENAHIFHSFSPSLPSYNELREQ